MAKEKWMDLPEKPAGRERGKVDPRLAYSNSSAKADKKLSCRREKNG
jgi:hypothetical protein